MQDQQEIEALRAKVEDLEARNRELELTAAPPKEKRQRWRGALAVVLIVASVLVAPAAAMGTWVRAQLVDTDRFVATFAPLAEDPAVQAFVSDQAVAAIEANVDIDALVGDLFDGISELDLPPRAAAALPLLEAPAASGVRSLIDTSVDRVIASDQFAQLWEGVLRETHSRAVAVIQNDPNAVLELDADGTLSLRLGLLIGQVKQTLVDQGMGFAEIIPEVDRSIPLAASDSLTQVRAIYQIAVAGGYWLPWVALGLLVVGVAVARNRPRALAWGGLCLTVAFLLLSFGIWIGRGIFIGSVSPSIMPRAAAEALFDQLTVIMHSTIIALTVLSAFIALGAWLFGSSRPARAVRGAGDAAFTATRAAAARHGLSTGGFGRVVDRWRPTIQLAAVLLGVLVIFLNRPVTMSSVIATVLVVALVLVIVELVRRPEGSEAEEPGAQVSEAEAAEPAPGESPALQ